MAIQPLLTTDQVCAIFQITDRTLRNWLKDDKKNFPAAAIKGYPNKWRESDIENYINPKTQNAA